MAVIIYDRQYMPSLFVGKMVYVHEQKRVDWSTYNSVYTFSLIIGMFIP